MQLLQELSLKNGPLCVGLDTDPSYIPENIIAQYESAPVAVLAYNKAIIDRVVSDKSACCFKVQIAYYEAMGLEGLDVSVKANVVEFMKNCPALLKAISMGAVFFGAMTYIGNGPNFMVKSIADQAHIKTPTFFGYLFKYSIPVLLPVFVVITILFFSKWAIF